MAERDALVKICGGEDMAARVERVWEEMMEKKRIDLSGQRMTDEDFGFLLKGLHMFSRTSGYQTERIKPFPITELDFSGAPLPALQHSSPTSLHARSCLHHPHRCYFINLYANSADSAHVKAACELKWRHCLLI
uniref:Uncharacterized protein n=1 Tax=Chrysotila carterae TaxID=13221 RepID=A0A7S4BI96_CHRCT